MTTGKAKSTGAFKCNYCPNQFDRANSLSQHEAMHRRKGHEPLVQSFTPQDFGVDLRGRPQGGAGVAAGTEDNTIFHDDFMHHEAEYEGKPR